MRVKKTRRTKVVIAVTIPELPDGWKAHSALNFLRQAVAEKAASLPQGEMLLLESCTLRVQSTVEETVYDASVGGKRGGSHDADTK
jgi:hypothetical protein